MTCSGSTPATIWISSDSRLLPGNTARPESLSASVLAASFQAEAPFGPPAGMAGNAAIGQDRQNLAVEIDLVRRRRGQRGLVGGTRHRGPSGRQSTPAETGQQQSNQAQHANGVVGSWRQAGKAGGLNRYCLPHGSWRHGGREQARR